MQVGPLFDLKVDNPISHPGTGQAAACSLMRFTFARML